MDEGIIEDKKSSCDDGKDGKTALPSIKLTECPKKLTDLRLSCRPCQGKQKPTTSPHSRFLRLAR